MIRAAHRIPTAPRLTTALPALALGLALGLAVAVLLPTTLAAQDARPSADAWPQFRGGPEQDGIAVSTLPDQLAPLWTYTLPEGAEATAAIADGRVYVAGLSGKVAALDAETGKETWTFEAGEEIKSSPLVHGGAVYFGDELGKLYALDAETGKTKWTFEAEAAITSSPNLAGGCLIVGSYDNHIYCIDAEKGTVRWKVETEGYIHGTPAILGDHLVSSGCDGFLRLVKLSSGEVEKQLQIGSYVAASPAVRDGKVYVGTFDNEVVAVDPAKGESGEVLWRYKHPRREFPFYSSPAVTDELLVIGGRDKMVHALDPKTGESKWTHSLRTRVDASPVIVRGGQAGDRVIIADKSGQLLVLSLKDGEVLFEFTANDAFLASPAVASGLLVIPAGDGVVYAFGAKS